MPVSSVTASAIAAATWPDPPAGPYGTIIVKARSGNPPGLSKDASPRLHSNANAEPPAITAAHSAAVPIIFFIFYLPYGCRNVKQSTQIYAQDRVVCIAECIDDGHVHSRYAYIRLVCNRILSTFLCHVDCRTAPQTAGKRAASQRVMCLQSPRSAPRPRASQRYSYRANFRFQHGLSAQRPRCLQSPLD